MRVLIALTVAALSPVLIACGPTVTVVTPAAVSSAVVAGFNETAAKQGSILTATSAECMKTDAQVFNCVIHLDDGSQVVHAFTVSEDGQRVMSKNS